MTAIPFTPRSTPRTVPFSIVERRSSQFQLVTAEIPALTAPLVIRRYELGSNASVVLVRGERQFVSSGKPVIVRLSYVSAGLVYVGLLGS